MKKIRLFWLVLTLFITQIFVINYLLSHLNIKQTSLYNSVFISISKFQRYLFGEIYFSVGDVFYTILGFYFIFILIKWVINIKKNTLNFFTKLIGIITVIYFCFYFFWGFNYARIPLSQTLKLDLKSVEINDLISLTELLISKANTLQLKLSKTDSLKVTSPYKNRELLKQASLSFEQLAKQWPEFTYQTPSLKYSLFSLPLSYMGYSGYYNPFSGEAQVNDEIVKSFIPFTACHEIGHQIGFAAEQEANFLSYLACVNSQDNFVQYSGYLVALSYSLSNLNGLDQAVYKKLIKTIHRGVLKNLQENYDFWKAHQNPSNKLFASFYDHFLKANKQTQGIQSYYGIIKLIVAYYKTYPLKKS